MPSLRFIKPLTRRQTAAVKMAVASGFFEFPRKVTLAELAKMYGVKPSTMSEILRGAERRVFSLYMAANGDVAAWAVDAKARPRMEAH